MRSMKLLQQMQISVVSRTVYPRCFSWIFARILSDPACQQRRVKGNVAREDAASFISAQHPPRIHRCSDSRTLARVYCCLLLLVAKSRLHRGLLYAFGAHTRARTHAQASRKKSVVKCVAAKCNLDVRQPVETSGFHQRNLDLVSSPEVQFAFSITPSNRSWRGRRCTARTKKKWK